MTKFTASMMLLAGSLAAVSSASYAAQRTKPTTGNVPMVQDWSTDRVFFGKPDTPEEARAHGHYARWQELAKDPRFMLALLHRLKNDADIAYAPRNAKGQPLPPPPAPPLGPIESMHRDWSNVLGGGTDGNGGSGVVDVFPAKYSFSTTALPDCANDFIVYGTNATGSSTTGNSASWLMTFSAATSTGAVTIGTSPRNITLTAGLAVGSGTQFQTTNNATTNRDNFIAAVNRWSGRTGFRAETTATTGQVKIVQNAGGVGASGTVTETLTNAGPISFTAGTAGAGQPSIMAFNQLYNTTCAAGRTNANAPNVYWAYNTGGIVRTSPVLSFNDNAAQVAFIQSVSGNAELVLLKWKPGPGQGTAVAPLTPALESAANYRAGTGACATGACMFKVVFSPAADDLISSPFVDYGGDALYVGMADGTLRKVTGIFAGTPTEVGAPFSTVSAGNALSSPVYNFNSGDKAVFVGSASKSDGTGGSLHKINAVTGGAPSATSTKLTLNTDNSGVRASPMIDVVNKRAYAFVLFGTTAAAPLTNCTTGPCREMIEFGGSFLPSGSGNRVLLGSSAGYAATQAQAYGTFSTAWRSSGNGTGPLYVCGGSPGTGAPTLWKVPITNGQIGAATQGATVASATGVGCSPMMRVKNGVSDDFLYFSVASSGDDGLSTACTGACLYLYNTADLNGNSTDTNEVWSVTFPGGGGANVTIGNLVLNPGNVTLTCSNVASATTANCTAGSGATAGVNRATNMVALVNSYSATTGIVASNVGGTSATMTLVQLGNVTDTNIASTLNSNGGVALTVSHTDGTSPAGGIWGTTNSPAAGLTTPSGSGGMIIDNARTDIAGAAQVYFGQLSATGNAVQASQAGLQ